MGSCSKFFVFSVFLLLLLSVSIRCVSAVDEDVVSLGLADAEEVLVSAYDAVLEAEEAGVNVSGLVVRLNLGGEYLAEAYVWYRLGVSENASRFAGLCISVVGGVRSEAFALRDEANRVGEDDSVVKLVGSVVGVVAVLIGGFMVWRVFRRRYVRRILGLRPEVASGES
jgi:hypothetical protein